MLTLNDGRKELYQWDTGRTATIYIECEVVHFSNLKYGGSLPVEVKNGEVAIPNKLLTSGEPIYCWAFVSDENGNYTKQEQTLNVNKRAKPSDYVYTETETLTWKSLDERITELEKGGTGGSDAVKYTEQELTDEQKSQARTNIGAVSVDEVPIATNDVAGVVKPASKTDEMTQPVGVDENGALFTTEHVQGNWLQNTETAADYVKNRPGGYYEWKNVNIFNISYIMTSGSNSQNVTTPNQRIDTRYGSITVYEDYSEAYYVLPKRHIPGYILQEGEVDGYGNSSLCGYGNDTGEKYFIVYADRRTKVYCKPNDSIIGRTITLEAYAEKNVPKTFDSSFMPIIREQSVGCGKAELIRDTSTVSSQYSKIFATEDGTLYCSGKTLPGTGKNGQVPVFENGLYRLKSFGKLDGGESSYYNFDYTVSENTADIVFILNSKTTTNDYVLKFAKSDYNAIATVRIKFDSNNGSTVIHINRIVEGYISYRVYNGEVIGGGSENNFMECRELKYVRLTTAGGNVWFTAEMYGN